jgi:hypothetical protein
MRSGIAAIFLSGKGAHKPKELLDLPELEII